MGCFSFYPGKNLGAYGEGGALVTNDDRIAARVRSLREHGQTERYYHDEIGYNYRMDSFQGAVLGIKLKHLDKWNDARSRKAMRYTELLADSGVSVPSTFSDAESVWHCYVIEVDDRDAVRAKLSACGIDTGLHYPRPLHLQRAYASLGYQHGNFPASERLAARCLSLPIYPEITDEQVQRVVSALDNAVNLQTRRR
jgi:dTDP-4-amino-4,6-dideoxygalactose transaminase